MEDSKKARTQLYEMMKADGYDDLPSSDSFDKTLNDSTGAHQIYTMLKEDGYDDLPDEDTFIGTMVDPVNPASPATSPGQREYSQEVYDRYNNQVPKRDGKGGINMKDLDEIAAEMEQENTGSSKPGMLSSLLGTAC